MANSGNIVQYKAFLVDDLTNLATAPEMGEYFGDLGADLAFDIASYDASNGARLISMKLKAPEIKISPTFSTPAELIEQFPFLESAGTTSKKVMFNSKKEIDLAAYKKILVLIPKGASQTETVAANKAKWFFFWAAVPRIDSLKLIGKNGDPTRGEAVFVCEYDDVKGCNGEMGVAAP